MEDYKGDRVLNQMLRNEKVRKSFEDGIRCQKILCLLNIVALCMH